MAHRPPPSNKHQDRPRRRTSGRHDGDQNGHPGEHHGRTRQCCSAGERSPARRLARATWQALRWWPCSTPTTEEPSASSPGRAIASGRNPGTTAMPATTAHRRRYGLRLHTVRNCGPAAQEATDTDQRSCVPLFNSASDNRAIPRDGTAADEARPGRSLPHGDVRRAPPTAKAVIRRWYGRYECHPAPSRCACARSPT